MTTYTFNFADSTKSPITLAPYYVNGPTSPSNAFPLQHNSYPTTPTPTTSIVFYGKGISDYGEKVQQNMLNMLENFAHSSAPVYPIAGQLWYDSAIQHLKVYDGFAWKDIVSGATNGDINGQLDIHGTPTLPTHIATKGYVDAVAIAASTGGVLSSSYDELTGTLHIELSSINFTDVIIPSINSLSVLCLYDEVLEELSVRLSNGFDSVVNIPNADKLTITSAYNTTTQETSVTLSNGASTVIPYVPANITQHVIVVAVDSYGITVPQYIVGTNRVWVFRNGMKQILGATEDYIETDSTTITFNTLIPANTKLELMYF